MWEIQYLGKPVCNPFWKKWKIQWASIFVQDSNIYLYIVIGAFAQEIWFALKSYNILCPYPYISGPCPYISGLTNVDLDLVKYVQNNALLYMDYTGKFKIFAYVYTICKWPYTIWVIYRTALYSLSITHLQASSPNSGAKNTINNILCHLIVFVLRMKTNQTKQQNNCFYINGGLVGLSNKCHRWWHI